VLLKDEVINSARKKISTDSAALGTNITIAKAPQRGTLVIPGTKEADKSKGEGAKDGTDHPKATGADIFTAVVGVESGQLIIFVWDL
jgi:DNA excision repair protein ERCC-3